MIRWLPWLRREKAAPPSESELRFYAEAARLDLSVFEDERFIRDRSVERLGTIRLGRDGTCTLDTPDRELRRRFRRLTAGGVLEVPVGGMTDDGTLWDGRELLDARVGHNVLLFLIAWNNVGVFSVDTQQALETLRRRHRIRRVLHAPPASPAD